jgi:transcriptional regulator with XRE-family HTH domain
MSEGEASMVSGDPPAVARRRVRLALRGAREAKGLTQGQVAAALDWSLSKVNRIESGEVSVSGTDLRAMLAFYGITDPVRVDRLLDDARVSRRQRSWWADPKYREHLTSATMQLLQFESEASALRQFHLTIVPGLFQTPPYANVILRSFAGELSEDAIQVRFEVRMRRRQQVLDKAAPPDLFLILDESVLHREVGGPAVMAEQLRELLRLGQAPNVLIRVVPLAVAAPIALLGPFMILDLGDEEDAILYRETHLSDSVVHTPLKIKEHREIFEQLWERSLDDANSARLIETRATAMLYSLDRQEPSG